MKTNEIASELPLAPAVFIGTQPGFENFPSVDLYNLTADIDSNHLNGTTVSARTLISFGFRVPPRTHATDIVAELTRNSEEFWNGQKSYHMFEIRSFHLWAVAIAAGIADEVRSFIPLQS